MAEENAPCFATLKHPPPVVEIEPLVRQIGSTTRKIKKYGKFIPRNQTKRLYFEIGIKDSVAGIL